MTECNPVLNAELDAIYRRQESRARVVTAGNCAATEMRDANGVPVDLARYWWMWWSKTQTIHSDGTCSPWRFRLTRYWLGMQAYFDGWCDG